MLLLAVLLGPGWDGKTANRTADPELVYRAYYQASMYPESFDLYVAQTSALKTEEFWKCWDGVQLGLALRFSEVTRHCDLLDDSEARRACKDVDEAKVSLVLDGIAATIKNGTPFSNTVAGAALLMGKKLVGSQYFERLQGAYLPALKPVLTCK